MPIFILSEFLSYHNRASRGFSSFSVHCKSLCEFATQEDIFLLYATVKKEFNFLDVWLKRLPQKVANLNLNCKRIKFLWYVNKHTSLCTSFYELFLPCQYRVFIHNNTNKSFNICKNNTCTLLLILGLWTKTVAIKKSGILHYKYGHFPQYL